MLDDGSGLSEENRVTCALLASLLEADGSEGVIAAGLARPGEPGTLDDKLLAQDLRGRVRAKTGTLRPVTALSGWLRTVPERDLGFSFIINRPGGQVTEADTSLQADLLTAMLGYPQTPDPAAAVADRGGTSGELSDGHRAVRAADVPPGLGAAARHGAAAACVRAPLPRARRHRAVGRRPGVRLRAHRARQRGRRRRRPHLGGLRRPGGGGGPARGRAGVTRDRRDPSHPGRGLAARRSLPAGDRDRLARRSERRRCRCRRRSRHRPHRGLGPPALRARRVHWACRRPSTTQRSATTRRSGCTSSPSSVRWVRWTGSRCCAHRPSTNASSCSRTSSRSNASCSRPVGRSARTERLTSAHRSACYK